MDFSKDKMVFSSYYFLIYFKGLIGVKPSFSSDKKKDFLRLGFLEKREEKKKKKGERERFHQECQEILVKFIGGDPYSGMWDLSCWDNSPTHQFATN